MSKRINARILLTVATIMILSALYVFRPRYGHQLAIYPEFGDYNELSDRGGTAEKGFLVSGPRCTIPDIKPWGKSIREFFKSSGLVRCTARPLLTTVITMNNGTYLLTIEKEAISSYKQRSEDVLTCCYSDIIRVDETVENYDAEADNKFRYSKCKDFKMKVLLPNTTEFIRVKCLLKRKHRRAKEVYRDAHAVVPILPSALKKVERQEKLGGRINPPSAATPEEVRQNGSFRNLSIMILGIDSVSRLNFRRTMSQTLRYLRQNEWIELDGYTKVGDNTLPNLMAILSGISAKEVLALFYQNRTRNLDDYPFIWKQFSEMNYVTAYAEDTPEISTFNYLRTGFVQKPTDYYIRPFMSAVHASLKKKQIFGLPVCVGPVAPVDHILNYARRFLYTFNGFNTFSLFWMNSFSHNDPRMSANMDRRILNFLHDLSDIGTYTNTVIFLLSDHGTRFGPFRHDFLAYYEERLPFMFIWFPEWFKRQYPRLYNNVVINQKRLTCPFDVHLTLMKILEGDYTENQELRKLSACPKCTSLFETMPWSRSCQDAGIQESWCMCNEFRPIAATEAIVIKVAQAIRDEVANRLRQTAFSENINDSICANWSLHKVLRAHEITPGVGEESEDRNRQTRSHKLRRVLVLVQLNPGKTNFEAIAEVRNEIGKSETIKVKTPSRLDGYWKVTRCTDSPRLKYYCYCKKMS